MLDPWSEFSIEDLRRFKGAIESTLRARARQDTLKAFPGLGPALEERRLNHGYRVRHWVQTAGTDHVLGALDGTYDGSVTIEAACGIRRTTSVEEATGRWIGMARGRDRCRRCEAEVERSTEELLHG